MNDFTKEELEDLLYAARVMYKNGYDYPSDKPAYIIYDKLESVIENYCEHEWENTCCNCNIDTIYCHKCDKYMENK